MARPVVLGNGSLTVGLDEFGFVHDFYYPYVGLENLTNARSQPHHIGVWVDGEFSWLSDGDWERTISMQSDVLFSDITVRNERLAVSIKIQDFVDCHYNVFARRLDVTNLSEHTKEVRVFFHQIFKISAEGRADTAMYVPDGHYLLDYKGRCSILAYAEDDLGKAFDQFAVGNAGIEGKEGTFRDAEDGELSGSTVEHAGVDSALRCSVTLEPQATRKVNYWLAVADSQQNLDKLHQRMLGDGFGHRMHATHQHWADWLHTSSEARRPIPQKYQESVKKSLLILKSHIDVHGGVIASCDSSIYNYGRDYYSYVWPRDGAYVIWPLIKLGYTHEAKKFLQFCHSIMHKDGYMMHKYQPDRAIGSTWHPLMHGNRKELAIQEDETAIVLFMFNEYIQASGDTKFLNDKYDSFIRPMAEFMTRYIDTQSGLPHASYDLWEEKFLTSTYSTAITYRALKIAADYANKQGITMDAERWNGAAAKLAAGAASFFFADKNAYIKGFLLDPDNNTVHADTVLDVSSFYGPWRFDYGSDSHVSATIRSIEKRLFNSSPSGGTPRYEDDGYFRSEPAYLGNPWFVTTLWLAQYYAENDRADEASAILDWTQQHALRSGALSEQINPTTGKDVGVTPLVWSHAEFINTAVALAK